MKRIQYFGSILFVLCVVSFAGMAQTYHKGDTVQVKVNGVWTNALIKNIETASNTHIQTLSVMVNPGTASQRGVSIKLIGKDLIKPKAAPVSDLMVQQTHKEVITQELTGKYAIYSGVQKTYIGHFILFTDGSYKVALSSAEDIYGNGAYVFQSDTHIIQWKSGLFYNNNWTGKLFTIDENAPRIRFNSQTYADKISGLN